MQDQAFLGPESGLAVPDEDGGVDLYIATQWLHVDRDQVAACLDLPPEKVRFTLARRRRRVRRARGPLDADPRVHAGAAHRSPGEDGLQPRGVVLRPRPPPPGAMRYEHGATRDGRLVFVRARIVLDGGAYASSTARSCPTPRCFALGPYEVPNARIDCYVVYTNNPPCGAMRGFGAVQVLRARGADGQAGRGARHGPGRAADRNAMTTGTSMPTGAPINCPAPVAELLESRARAAARPARTGACPAGSRT